jgi:hypothetical protein
MRTAPSPAIALGISKEPMQIPYTKLLSDITGIISCRETIIEIHNDPCGREEGSMPSSLSLMFPSTNTAVRNGRILLHVDLR